MRVRVARVQLARMAVRLARMAEQLVLTLAALRGGAARPRAQVRVAAPAVRARRGGGGQGARPRAQGRVAAPAVRARRVAARQRARVALLFGGRTGLSANGVALPAPFRRKAWVPRPTSVIAAASNTTTPTTRAPLGSRVRT